MFVRAPFCLHACDILSLGFFKVNLAIEEIDPSRPRDGDSGLHSRPFMPYGARTKYVPNLEECLNKCKNHPARMQLLLFSLQKIDCFYRVPVRLENYAYLIEPTLRNRNNVFARQLKSNERPSVVFGKHFTLYLSFCAEPDTDWET